MTMTNEEIVRDYRSAKSKRSQIGVLADLNDCTKLAIVDILTAAGEPVPAYYKPKEARCDQPGDPSAAAPPQDDSRAALPQDGSEGAQTGSRARAAGKPGQGERELTVELLVAAMAHVDAWDAAPVLVNGKPCRRVYVHSSFDAATGKWRCDVNLLS